MRRRAHEIGPDWSDSALWLQAADEVERLNRLNTRRLAALYVAHEYMARDVENSPIEVIGDAISALGDEHPPLITGNVTMGRT